MELKRVTTANLNLTAEATVLSYLYTAADPIEVIARVDLGDAAKPIAGGGTYILNFYINGVLVTPISTDPITAGIIRTVVVSRPVPIYTGDTVSLKMIGLASDTAVNVVASLRSATPLQKTDVYGGGPVAVDHNYGGTNNLAYKTAAGAGIVGATVLAYLSADYTAGNTGSAFVVARAATTTGGQWLQPMMLNPASYTLQLFLQGVYGPDTRTVAVTA